MPAPDHLNPEGLRFRIRKLEAERDDLLRENQTYRTVMAAHVRLFATAIRLDSHYGWLITEATVEDIQEKAIRDAVRSRMGVGQPHGLYEPPPDDSQG